MDGRTNIGAWTPVGANSPQFVSVNQYAHVIEIIVRSPAGEDGRSGPTATATMSHSQFDGLLERLLEARKAGGKPDDTDDDKGCPMCGYDCAGANPPIAGCPLRRS